MVVPGVQGRGGAGQAGEREGNGLPDGFCFPLWPKASPGCPLIGKAELDWVWVGTHGPWASGAFQGWGAYLTLLLTPVRSFPVTWGLWCSWSRFPEQALKRHFCSYQGEVTSCLTGRLLAQLFPGSLLNTKYWGMLAPQTDLGLGTKHKRGRDIATPVGATPLAFSSPAPAPSPSRRQIGTSAPTDWSMTAQRPPSASTWRAPTPAAA